jgi:hypothetical protein
LPLADVTAKLDKRVDITDRRRERPMLARAQVSSGSFAGFGLGVLPFGNIPFAGAGRPWQTRHTISSVSYRG